jgi:hypothetical protein
MPQAIHILLLIMPTDLVAELKEGEAIESVPFGLKGIAELVNLIL